VVALVKKDKAPEELKHVCKDQLEVFLSDGKLEEVFLFTKWGWKRREWTFIGITCYSTTYSMNVFLFIFKNKETRSRFPFTLHSIQLFNRK
jgi:hypothetical protein